MWKKYEVELRFTTPFAGSVPKHPGDIEAMLLARAPSDAAVKRRMEEGEDITPIPELAEKVGKEVDATEEVERGYATGAPRGRAVPSRGTIRGSILSPGALGRILRTALTSLGKAHLKSKLSKLR